jgi:hypothetical protein
MACHISQKESKNTEISKTVTSIRTKSWTFVSSLFVDKFNTYTGKNGYI